MGKKKIAKLPTKASALLRIAVEDAQKLEKTPGFRLNMGDWVNPVEKKNGEQICEVCMAGAVMVCRLGVDPGEHKEPYELEGLDSTLCMINDMREGDFCYHVDTQDADRLEALDKCESLIRQHLSGSGRAPWRIYLKAAEILEGVGL